MSSLLMESIVVWQHAQKLTEKEIMTQLCE